MNIHEYVGKYVVLTDSSDFNYIMYLSSITDSRLQNSICYAYDTDLFWKNGGEWGGVKEVKFIRLASSQEVKKYLRHEIKYYEIY